MDKLGNAAEKYDNTKLKAFLTLSCLVVIGVVVYWIIITGVFGVIGYSIYPLLMIIHMFVLKDEQRHKLF